MFRTGPLKGAAKVVTPLIAAGMLVGCSGGGNHSNPTLEITHATVSGDQAVLDLQISNESGADLILSGIEYTLIYGPLPVADGSWSGRRDLPGGSTTRLTLSIPFDGPALDDSAMEINFAGQMSFEDASASGDMAMQTAGFDETSPVKH